MTASVTVFTRTGCGPCRATKAYLGKYQIPFREFDVTDDEDTKEWLISTGHKQVPVVSVFARTEDGYVLKSWSGHDSEKLEELKHLIEENENA